MITAEAEFHGVRATISGDGWASEDEGLAADLNAGWPVTGGEVGHPVLRAFHAAVKDLKGKAVRADEAPPHPAPGGGPDEGPEGEGEEGSAEEEASEE